jgi:hypothetical protein
LIITIVKSSLALSLGLVGALSIVRFRTPVKEPEELAYLFMAIAIGLGMGADYRLETSVGTILILALVASPRSATIRTPARPMRATPPRRKAPVAARPRNWMARRAVMARSARPEIGVRPASVSPAKG